MRPPANALICGLVLFVSGLSAQDSEVRGARISLKPNAVAIERITIENRRNSPLVAWEIGFFKPGSTQPSITHYSDFILTSPAANGEGPIKPNERRVIEVQAHREEADRVALRVVVFADGYDQGEKSALASWRQRRQERADDIAYWIRTVTTMPHESAQQVRQYLAESAIERAGQVKGDPSGLRARMAAFSGQQTATLGSLLASIDRVRAEAAGDLAVLRRSLVANLPDNSDGQVTSATIASERAAGSELVAAIENLRNVPLEALEFEAIESNSRGGSSSGIDYCSSGPGLERGHGSLMPGEVREFPLGRRLKEGETPPTVRLKYVMFDDLAFEGSPADRVLLLRRREERAEELTYAIAALTEAASRPAEAAALLTAKRAERARQLQQLGRHGVPFELDELIREAKASPGQLAANARTLHDSYERQRQRLLRHRSR